MAKLLPHSPPEFERELIAEHLYVAVLEAICLAGQMCHVHPERSPNRLNVRSGSVAAHLGDKP
jgi:hypothetical protein